ncbi:MAG: hypothetical protein ABL977_13020 [Candidatus Eisenbacteria bacterium]
MFQAKRVMMTAALLAVLAPVAGAVVVKQERVPGGALEQTWTPGFGVGRIFTPLALPAGDLAIPTPSGDNTVAVLQNVDVGLGGIAACATDPSGYSDYTWEGYFFTGAGNTRRGLLLRADPADGFQTYYQFVINPGLFQVRFRKFIAGAPLPDLASWTLNTLPAGVPTVNSWHHMKVIALANQFRCFFDGLELTTTPIVDPTPILGGWVGAYNFSAAVGEVPVYFDDLKLSIDGAVPTRPTSWGAIKKLYR